MMIRTFQDACIVLKLNSQLVIPEFSQFPKKYQKAIEAYAKLVIIVEALNEGWHPDWNDEKEKKYEPLFVMDNYFDKGFYLLASDDYNKTISVCGSRLCYRTEKLCKYAAEQFTELYKDFLIH
ncbi:MAG: hypothetical protein ABGX00_12990 [Allomuricauda sp.]